MKPIFTVHEGEFLVGDRISRKLGRKFEVWVPTKDSGIDLLLTRKGRRGRSIGLQVKFSRSFDIPGDLARNVVATSWFSLDATKIRRSRADLWVFVILTLRHEQHFVLVPTRDLRRRIPPRVGRKWNLYLWVLDDGSCYQVRGLGEGERRKLSRHGVRESRRDFSRWLEDWSHLDRLTKKAP